MPRQLVNSKMISNRTMIKMIHSMLRRPNSSKLKRNQARITVQVLSSGLNSFLPKPHSPPQIIKMDPEPLWKLASGSSYFVKIAGISGASAVILGAYGAHSILPDEEKDENLKKAFETANRYHFFHTLALLGVPLSRYPSLSGSLFLLGLSMFCGTCYYSALTGDHRLRRLTPIGGTFLILGWMALFI